MYNRALAGREKAWGPEHTSTLDTVNNLGNLYKNQGHLDDAERMYPRSAVPLSTPRAVDRGNGGVVLLVLVIMALSPFLLLPVSTPLAAAVGVLSWWWSPSSRWCCYGGGLFAALPVPHQSSSCGGPVVRLSVASHEHGSWLWWVVLCRLCVTRVQAWSCPLSLSLLLA